MRTTRTYALLAVSPAAFNEIATKLKAAGYAHAFNDDAIDMNGIALVVNVEVAKVVHLDTRLDDRRWCGADNDRYWTHEFADATCLACLLACAEYGEEARRRYQTLGELLGQVCAPPVDAAAAVGAPAAGDVGARACEDLTDDRT